MTTTLLQPGECVDHADIPEELQNTPEHIQTHVMATGDEPLYTVPTQEEVLKTDIAVERILNDLERLKMARETITSSGTKLSKVAVAALSASMECLCDKPHFVPPQAFASGEEGSGAHALEAIEQQSRSLIERLIELMSKWAQQAWLWIKSAISKRAMSQRIIADIKRQLPNIDCFQITPSGWQARGLIPAAYAASHNHAEAFTKMRSSYDDLTKQMQGFLESASGMFRETSTTKMGVFKGPYALWSLGTYINRNKNNVLNPTGIGGHVWRYNIEKITDDTTEYPVFSMTAGTIDFEPGTIDMKVGAVRVAVDIVEKALKDSEKITADLIQYVKVIPTVTSGFRRAGTTIVINPSYIRSLMSAASILRNSVSHYEAILFTAAKDLNRGLRTAKFKNQPQTQEAA